MVWGGTVNRQRRVVYGAPPRGVAVERPTLPRIRVGPVEMPYIQRPVWVGGIALVALALLAMRVDDSAP